MGKILASLPPKFNGLTTAWDSVDSDQQNVNNLQERLLKEEARFFEDDEAATAFAAMKFGCEKYEMKKMNQKGSKKNIENIEFFNCRKRRRRRKKIHKIVLLFSRVKVMVHLRVRPLSTIFKT